MKSTNWSKLLCFKISYVLPSHAEYYEDSETALAHTDTHLKFCIAMKHILHAHVDW
jgi:hypothetical protein